ncbi:hypothetical protein R1sor_010510 [Riccia sorocarpa]|uniref:Uncharacterized protein n=1 Tax=Riccia sorocarpa TaxID=122646 RepID=A0ABD3I1N4_9MARC
MVRVYEECHRVIEQEITGAFGLIHANEVDPIALRYIWELLRKYNASVHSLAALHVSTHEACDEEVQQSPLRSGLARGPAMCAIIILTLRAAICPGRVAT